MVMVAGSPLAPDAAGSPWRTTDADDQAATWSAHGGREGLLRGGDLSTVPGSLVLEVAPFAGLVATRDAAGTRLAQGYHLYSHSSTTVAFDPPDPQTRNDALVLVMSDLSAGSGAYGAAVTASGPQVVVSKGTSGTSTPRTDAEIQTDVGSGGWLRLADVPIAPGQTQIDSWSSSPLAHEAGPVWLRASYGATPIGVAAGATKVVPYTVAKSSGPEVDVDLSGGTITVPAGVYRLGYSVGVDALAEHRCWVQVRLNGAKVSELAQPGSATDHRATIASTDIVEVADGDVLDMTINTPGDTNAGLNIQGVAAQTHITLDRIA